MQDLVQVYLVVFALNVGVLKKSPGVLAGAQLGFFIFNPYLSNQRIYMEVLFPAIHMFLVPIAEPEWTTRMSSCSVHAHDPQLSRVFCLSEFLLGVFFFFFCTPFSQMTRNGPELTGHITQKLLINRKDFISCALFACFSFDPIRSSLPHGTPTSQAFPCNLEVLTQHNE
jgi:hypothetical protein